jgi:hypothetical protein
VWNGRLGREVDEKREDMSVREEEGTRTRRRGLPDKSNWVTEAARGA